MWLLLHTKKSFSNTLSSASSSEADLGGEEEPEYVAYWEGQWCIPRDSPIWHTHDQLKVELRKYPETFQNLVERSVVVSGNNIPAQEAFGSKPQVSCHSSSPGFWCQVFRHAVLLRGRYENPLYSGQGSM